MATPLRLLFAFVLALIRHDSSETHCIYIPEVDTRSLLGGTAPRPSSGLCTLRQNATTARGHFRARPPLRPTRGSRAICKSRMARSPGFGLLDNRLRTFCDVIVMMRLFGGPIFGVECENNGLKISDWMITDRLFLTSLRSKITSERKTTLYAQ